MKRLWQLTLLLASCGVAQAQYFSSPPNVLTNTQPTSAIAMNQNYARVVSDGNTAFNAFEAQIAGISGTSVPAKAIVAFNLNTCPTGWVIANGTGGTPDMRGYFAKVTTGAVGTFSPSQFINHTHTIFGSYVTGLNSVSQFFTNGPQGRALGVNGSANIGSMITGNSASESRPKNVALLWCQKS